MEKEQNTNNKDDEQMVTKSDNVKKKKETSTVKSKSVTLKAKGNSLTGKPLDNIELNPQLGSDRQVAEQSRGGVVLTFGRMNPPTVGHEKLVNKVKDVARSKRATPLVYLSHSQDKKKNPLEYADKVRFARAAFGNVVQAANQRTLIDILKTIQNKFSELTLVVGSDRVKEFDNLLQKYNGKDYSFDKIDVVSAGERDPDAEGVSGMSASKMRDAAAKGDERKFASGLPKGLKSPNQAKSIYSLTRIGMQLQEELETEDLLSEALSIQQRRKRALIMRRYAPKIKRARELAKRKLAPEARLKKRAYKQAREIVRKRVAGKRGQNYANLSPAEKIQVDLAVEKRKKIIGKIAKRIMPKVKQAEFQRLKSFMKGQQMEPAHSTPKNESAELNAMFEQYAQNVDTTTVDDILEEMTNLVLDKMITEKQIVALEKRANRTGIDYDLLEQVYVRGLLDTMGDQHAAFNRVNAFAAGGKSAMNEDYDLYQQISEGRAPNKPYVKPHDGGRAWKASNKWGKVRYFGKDFKASAEKHAGINENLRNWFDKDHPKGDWVRIGTDGKIKGDCAREEGEGKPKCLPRDKAHSMSKEDRAKAARRKRRQDPETDRPGTGNKPINVKTEEYIEEKAQPTNPQLWSRAKSLARQKFDVYPSAYANGWAAKWYKSKGGGWKNVSEEVSIPDDLNKKLQKVAKQLDKAVTAHGRQRDVIKGLVKKDKKDVNEGKKHSWRTTGHYTIDGKEWLGDQHAHEGQVMTGKEHGPDSQRLYHFKDLPTSVRQKIQAKINESLNTDHYKALTDIKLNTKNRDMTTKEDGYGPLNPDDKNGSKPFWEEKAKMWNTTVEAAQQSLCGNCAAFNQSKEVLDKIAEGLGPEGDKINDLAGLGFCELWEFKCAAARTCDTWIHGGPITENFMDGKNPQDKGDAARYGLKGMSKAELKKVRSSDTASPRKKQLAHFMLNMVHKEDVDLDEALLEFMGTIPKPGPASKAHIADVTRRRMQLSQSRRKLKKQLPKLKVANEEVQLEEGVNDPAIFKAVFLAGGPGSGKSFMVGKTALPALGFKVINSDPAFEAALRKAGLSTEPKDIYSDQGQSIRQKAKALTKKKMDLALSGRLGLVIDGTGKDYDKIKRQSDRLREEGYEVAMIFVNTDLDTAITRNNRRSRKLPEAEVKKMWDDVQKNIGKFQQLFRNNMFIVDNSEGSDFENAALSTYRKIMTWSKKEPKSSIAKKWIKSHSVNEDLNLAFEELSQATKDRKEIDSVPRKKQERNKVARVSRPRHDRDDDEMSRQGHVVNTIGEEGNVQPKASKRLQGTDELVKALKADTPGEGKTLDESFNMAISAGVGITLTAADLGMKAQGGFALHPSVIENEDETDEDV